MYPRTHKLNLDRLTKKLKLRLINMDGLSTITGNVPSKFKLRLTDQEIEAKTYKHRWLINYNGERTLEPIS